MLGDIREVTGEPQNTEETLDAIRELNKAAGEYPIPDKRKTFSVRDTDGRVMLRRRAETALPILKLVQRPDVTKKDTLTLTQNGRATFEREILTEWMFHHDERAALEASSDSFDVPFGDKDMELRTWPDSDLKGKPRVTRIPRKALVKLPDITPVMLLDEHEVAKMTPAQLIRKFWEQYKAACLKSGVKLPEDLRPMF